MHTVTAVVYKEHTLGTLFDMEAGKKGVEILRGLISKGAPLNVYNDPHYCVDDNDYRLATLEDFETYRVVYHPSYLITK
jgi:hypothetical protein